MTNMLLQSDRGTSFLACTLWKRPWEQRSYNYYDWWSEGVRHI